MPGPEVSVLHDYFVDRIVAVDDFARLTSAIAMKAREGGGGIHGIEQREIKGGNAVNLAYALAKLGTRTFLVTHSGPEHESLLRRTFRGLGVGLSVKRRDAGLTVAIEGRTRGAKVNVMLGVTRGAGDFPPSLLDDDDWAQLAKSRVVCSVNWTANIRGTELLRALRAHIATRSRIFLDPADVRDQLARYADLLRLIKSRNLVDWIGLNEQEARATAKLLGVRGKRLGDLCLALAREMNLRVDIHSELESCTSSGSDFVSSRSGLLDPKQLTGAGDVWDAASIHFFLKGKDDLERLTLANSAAAHFVSSGDVEAPTERQDK